MSKSVKSNFKSKMANYWRTFWLIIDKMRATDIQSDRFRMPKQVIVRKHRPDWTIVGLMVLLMLIGLVFIYSLNSNYLVKHLVVVGLSLVAFGLVTTDYAYQKIKSLSKMALILAIVSALGLFIITLIPALSQHFAKCALGACRWYKIGSLTVQESEIIKLCTIIFFASFWAYLIKIKQFNSKANLIYSLVIIGLMEFFIVVLQNDLGTGVSLLGIILLMALMAGIRVRYLIISVVLMLVLGTLAIAYKPHRRARIQALFSGEGHHITQAKIAIGSGGLFGLGIGNSVQATGYLPEVMNDSIFAIVGEVAGFVGAFGLIVLYVFLTYRLLLGVAYSIEPYNRLLITGATSWIFSHFIINTFSMIGLAPITGITLPFLSYGGTSMLFVSIALGLAFNATRYTAHNPVSFKQNDKKVTRREKRS